MKVDAPLDRSLVMHLDQLEALVGCCKKIQASIGSWRHALLRALLSAVHGFVCRREMAAIGLTAKVLHTIKPLLDGA